MPRALRPLLITLALSSTLSLAACGGSNSSSGSKASAAPTPTQKTIAKADYITQGDAICKDLNTKLDALNAPSNDNDGKAVAGYLRQAAQLTEDHVNQLDALGRPDTDAATVDSIIANERDTITKARSVADTFDRGDIADGKAQANALDGNDDTLQSESKSFGFQVCGTE